MAIGGAAFRGRGWFMVAAAAGWMSMTGGCGSSGGGGSGGSDGGAVGGHGGAAVGGAGGHGTGGATDAGAIDAGGGHDGGITDGGDAAVDGSALSTLSFTFDSDLNGFDIDPTVTTNPVNLGGVSVDGGALVSANFDSTVGMPLPGSAHVSATFSDYNQLVVFRRVYSTVPINITGETLTARVRLDAGADGGVTQFNGGVARLFALSTPTTPGFYLAEGGSVTLNDNAWHTMTFRLTSAEFIDPSFDATQVVQIGVHIVTPPPITGDAAAPPYGAPQPVSIHIDTFTAN